MLKFKVLAGIVCLALCGWAGDNGNGNGNGNANGNNKDPDDHGKIVHDTREVFDAKGNAAGTAATSSQILYHNGPVMLGTTNVYYIWYGSWTDNSPTILQNLA